MTSMIIDKLTIEKSILALDNLIKIEIANNGNPDIYRDLRSNLKNYSAKMNDVKLENTLDALYNPVSKIIKEILSILEDGKVNLKDIGSFSGIINQLFKLRNLYPEVENEVKSLSKLEYQILASEVAGLVYDNINRGK